MFTSFVAVWFAEIFGGIDVFDDWVWVLFGLKGFCVLVGGCG